MIRFSLVLPAAFLAASLAHAQVDPATPVIDAGGRHISRAEFEALVSALPGNPPSLSDPAVRKALGQKLGQAFALESEAVRRKLDQDPKFKLQVRNYSLQLLNARLVEALRDQYLHDEPALRAAYEQRKHDFARPRVRHILVRFHGSPIALRPGAPDLSLDQAKTRAASLRAKLAAGADFAALARSESDDLVSAPLGGDLGFLQRGLTDAAFEAEAFRLAPGQLSQPIQTQNGFHILKVEERQPESFDAVRKTIANDLAHRDMESIALKDFHLNESYFAK